MYTYTRDSPGWVQQQQQQQRRTAHLSNDAPEDHGPHNLGAVHLVHEGQRGVGGKAADGGQVGVPGGHIGDAADVEGLAHGAVHCRSNMCDVCAQHMPGCEGMTQIH